MRSKHTIQEDVIVLLSHFIERVKVPTKTSMLQAVFDKTLHSNRISNSSIIINTTFLKELTAAVTKDKLLLSK